ncbi:hypothetical protein AAFF_G00424720 [Aldrovandia affinis]|uniref:Uncharacterized protein n=1 Tax=Aldrovandia affinis TaxID=143900 RepID=A0AAD7T7T3_9TELE|nr:hypothetical protein AAFF_G00424720 [Aldrovandia affinis]
MTPNNDSMSSTGLQEKCQFHGWKKRINLLAGLRAGEKAPASPSHAENQLYIPTLPQAQSRAPTADSLPPFCLTFLSAAFEGRWSGAPKSSSSRLRASVEIGQRLQTARPSTPISQVRWASLSHDQLEQVCEGQQRDPAEGGAVESAARASRGGIGSAGSRADKGGCENITSTCRVVFHSFTGVRLQDPVWCFPVLVQRSSCRVPSVQLSVCTLALSLTSTQLDPCIH